MKSLRFFAASLVVTSLILFPLAIFGQEKPTALHGIVVTKDAPMDGWVVFQAGRIQSISREQPRIADAVLIDTKGFIYPGFVDLHNHPMYSLFPRWSPHIQFQNRYEWRNYSSYLMHVGQPARKLQSEDQDFCDLRRFAELRAITGGTTSIHGISAQKPNAPKVPSCVKGIVRHLDWYSGLRGADPGNEKVIAINDISSIDKNAAAELQKKMSGGQIDRILIHLSEGRISDATTKKEFAQLESLGLLGKKTTIIHGIALGAAEFKKMAATHTSLIWAPRSNYVLYETTADIKLAKQLGVTIALAPDWGITGSSNALAELVFAHSLGMILVDKVFSDRELFEMSTLIPAKLANLAESIGSLKPNASADILVLRGPGTDPYKVITSAQPSDVQLVIVGGVPVFGTDQLVSQIGQKSQADALDVCGEQRVIARATDRNSETLSDYLARLEKRLSEFKLTRGPVIECP